MDSVRRYLPLVSVFVLALEKGAELAGYTAVASAVHFVSGLIGLTPDQETTTYVGVLGTAAAGAGVGLVLKLRALWKAARA